MPPDQTPHHDRGPASPVGEAMAWATRIMAIGLAMFIPGVVGGWLDDRFGLRLLGPLGFVLGFAAALTWLTQLAAGPKKERRP
jgi:MFS family permease